jgi:hypothetical protein
MYILNVERKDDVAAAFKRYRQYLAENEHLFPKSAYALASSQWYYDFNDHRCPHDSWLDSLVVQETGKGKRKEKRHTSITIRLLSAYQDGVIELDYKDVISYKMQGLSGAHDGCDWLYDEFLTSKQGHLMHQIEWGQSGRVLVWCIEAADVSLKWVKSIGT